MANNIVINVKPSFNMSAFAEQLAQNYRAKGFSVTIANVGTTCAINFEKDTSGFNNFLGLSKNVKASCMLSGDVLSINFSDQDWTWKIIACVVGWFICCIPFITGIVGIVGQSGLPKEIGNDATVIASSM